MSQHDDFYQGGGLNAATYDDRMSSIGTPTEGDSEFFIAMAEELGGNVLELGCGTGRVALAVADAIEARVVGLDLSESMLARAEEKLSANADLASRVRFVRGDMARFQLDEQFALIVIPFRSFQALLTVDDQRACLRCIRRHLAPGGRAVIDLFDPKLEFCVPNVDQTPKPRPGGLSSITGNQISVQVLSRVNDPVNQVLREKWVFSEADADGNVVAEDYETLALRWTYRQEMRHLFELEGFVVLAEYSDFHKSPPAYAKEMVWVVRAND